jgi:hypothetical protein
MTEMIEPMPAAIDLGRLVRDAVERTLAAGNFTFVREAAQGGYLRSREHGMVIVLCPHVQVVISPAVLSWQAVCMRSATGFQ